MATSSLVEFSDLISAKNRTESLALPNVKRINNIADYMADPLNFDGDIKKLADRLKNEAKQCQDVINLLRDQLQVKTTALTQVKEDMLELQRQLKEPDATFVYVTMKKQVLVKFFDETEVNEYDVPTALMRFNLKMSHLYGEILALDSDIDYVTYLKGIATVNNQYVKDWHKREMTKKRQMELEEKDPKAKESAESSEREVDSEEDIYEDFEEFEKFIGHDQSGVEAEKEPEGKERNKKKSEEKESEMKDPEDETEEDTDSCSKDPEEMGPGEEKHVNKFENKDKNAKGMLPEKKVSKEKVAEKQFPEEKEPEEKPPGQKGPKKMATGDKDAKLPEKNVPEDKWNQKKVTGKNASKAVLPKKLPGKKVSREKIIEKDVAQKNVQKVAPRRLSNQE
ncbi:GL10352 [Drosophila persimilis]|uniref:GL10352 n=1 Tax=Drosophila persimilis TaxID=7234 RepID=B4GDH6_DROPE|nr:calponin homology domain-containing protein DDB_G0272472 [Drosophila persimilis]EDW32606.1 GL10352 [Drosophila persimilis]